MAEIKPFFAIRPTKENAGRIAALPYDVYSRDEARTEVEREPLSFLKIDRADTQFGDEVAECDERVYEKARDILWRMVEEGAFQTDTQRCYYIYELTMAGRVQTGLVACASIDDYQNQIIRRHENTREEKEQDRIRHVEVCGAQTGPIFLAYRSTEAVNRIVVQAKETEPVYDFVSPDQVRHRVFLIDGLDEINRIREAFEGIHEIYIADGHHRAASAVKVGLKKRAEMTDYTGEEEFNSFLSVLFPDDQLMIMDYNRFVRDLNGHEPGRFLELAGNIFDMSRQAGAGHRPVEKGEFSMYVDHQWHTCRVRKKDRNQDPVGGLDVSLLQELLLGPVLGIGDPRTDERIGFVGGIRGLGELTRLADQEGGVAFAMYPTSIGELFAVADAGLLMPPKSTWFEPKLRSGLFLHRIQEG